MAGLLDTLVGKKPASPAAVDDTSLAQLTQAMGKDWAKNLSGSDKLATLGALLKSVSRGSTTSPQEVMQKAQANQLAQVQGRIQLQQLQTQAAQAAKNKLAIANYAAKLPPEDRKVFEDMPESEQLDLVSKGLAARGGEGTSAQKNYNWVMEATDPAERARRYQFVQAQSPQYLGSATTGYQVVQPTQPSFLGEAKVGDQKWVMGSAGAPVKAYYVNGSDGLGWYDNPEGK